ncbi:MAG TPA: hypothetical protein PLA87_18470, partial [Pseudomonadota bacterium]|nr:hypothetical protein [Pseudomonadota bacterium]
MLPIASDSRALRSKLVDLLSALQAYFEATSMNVGAGSGYFAAFDALRRNQHLAEAFVSDLQNLMEFLDREMLPALSQSASGGAPGASSGPARPAMPSILLSDESEPGEINDAETLLLHRLPPEIQRELQSGRPYRAPEPVKPAATPSRPATPSSKSPVRRAETPARPAAPATTSGRASARGEIGIKPASPRGPDLHPAETAPVEPKVELARAGFPPAEVRPKVESKPAPEPRPSVENKPTSDSPFGAAMPQVAPSKAQPARVEEPPLAARAAALMAAALEPGARKPTGTGRMEIISAAKPAEPPARTMTGKLETISPVRPAESVPARGPAVEAAPRIAAPVAKAEPVPTRPPVAVEPVSKPAEQPKVAAAQAASKAATAATPSVKTTLSGLGSTAPAATAPASAGAGSAASAVAAASVAASAAVLTASTTAGNLAAAARANAAAAPTKATAGASKPTTAPQPAVTPAKPASAAAAASAAVATA